MSMEKDFAFLAGEYDRKLHLCCGDIYLEGYENLDIKGRFREEGEELEQATTLDNYFKFPMGTPRREIVTDGQLNLTFPWEGYEDSTVDEIVMISAIEHFTKKEAEFIISEVKRVLKPGGKFIVDFPDIMQDVMDYYTQDPDYLMELIYCNQKDQYSVHHWGYTKTTFRELLGKDFNIKFETVVEHDYPMVGVIATKE